jgi:hypothetical protein
MHGSTVNAITYGYADGLSHLIHLEPHVKTSKYVM